MLLLVTLLALVSTARAQIVISQVYGGGGCGTAGCSTYKNDFIEIYNRSNAPVSLNGYSVQYAAATSTAWQVTALTNVTLQPGQYYLIAEAFYNNGITDLPSPDVSGTTPMNATSAKVALVSTTTALTGACPSDATILDFVGYGGTANCNEGGANAPAPSTTTAAIRMGGGCADTQNNLADFTAITPNPHNTSSAIAPCAVMPVTLGSFKGVYNQHESSVRLTWTTLSEENTDHFAVLRSADGNSWVYIGQIPAAGNSSAMKTYAITDAQPKQGRNLYRLAQVDADHYTNYSDIVSITLGKSAAGFTVAPNPANGSTWVRSANPVPTAVQIKVLNAAGRCVLEQAASLSLATPVRLDLSRLTSGQYFIQVAGSETTQTQKILIR